MKGVLLGQILITLGQSAGAVEASMRVLGRVKDFLRALKGSTTTPVFWYGDTDIMRVGYLAAAPAPTCEVFSSRLGVCSDATG